jgi:hypothetical protein
MLSFDRLDETTQFGLRSNNTDLTELWVLLSRHVQRRNVTNEFISLHAVRDCEDDSKAIVAPRTPVESVGRALYVSSGPSYSDERVVDDVRGQSTCLGRL